jgi:hypothetical protein
MVIGPESVKFAPKEGRAAAVPAIQLDRGWIAAKAGIHSSASEKPTKGSRPSPG